MLANWSWVKVIEYLPCVDHHDGHLEYKGKERYNSNSGKPYLVLNHQKYQTNDLSNIGVVWYAYIHIRIFKYWTVLWKKIIMALHTFEKYSLFKNINNVMDIFGYLIIIIILSMSYKMHRVNI